MNNQTTDLRRLFSLGFLMMLLAGCKKESIDTPTNVTGSFDYRMQAVNPTAVLSRVLGGSITWTSAKAYATQVKFEAKRGSAEVEFKTNVAQPVDLLDAANNTLGRVSLDSGTYSEVEFKAFLTPGNGLPALELKGNYTNSGSTIPVTFRVEETLILKAEKHNVSIDAANYQATAPVNLAQVLQNVPSGSFDNAVRSNGVILITASVNSNLYGILLNNLRALHDEAGFHR
jgi:hypothetical protein